MKAILHYDAGPNFRRMLPGVSERMDVVVVRPEDTSDLDAALVDADILLHVLAPVTAGMMEAAPRLQLIQKIGVGTDAIDLEEAGRRGIVVCNMPGTNTVAVAEQTLALMLSALRQTARLSALTAAGDAWTLSGRIGDGLGEIRGRTIGFIGYGAVPRHLTPILKAMGADLVAFTRTPGDGDVTFLPLEELLQRADIVSLHLPASAETQNILDSRRLATMKPGSILINTARGSLVDEAALVAALESRQIAAAGLDVFAEEPPSADNPLLASPHVVLAPHIAWLTAETLSRSLAVAAENARRLASGEDLLYRVV